MQQTQFYSGEWHGNIHGVLGGTWSAKAHEYAEVTPNIVQPFVQPIYVSVSKQYSGVFQKDYL